MSFAKTITNNIRPKTISLFYSGPDIFLRLSYGQVLKTFLWPKSSEVDKITRLTVSFKVDIVSSMVENLWFSFSSRTLSLSSIEYIPAYIIYIVSDI